MRVCFVKAQQKLIVFPRFLRPKNCSFVQVMFVSQITQCSMTLNVAFKVYKLGVLVLFELRTACGWIL